MNMNDLLAPPGDQNVAAVVRFKRVPDCSPLGFPAGLTVKGVGRTPNRDLVVYALARGIPGEPTHFVVNTYENGTGLELDRRRFLNADAAVSFAGELCDAPLKGDHDE